MCVFTFNADYLEALKIVSKVQLLVMVNANIHILLRSEGVVILLHRQKNWIVVGGLNIPEFYPYISIYNSILF